MTTRLHQRSIDTPENILTITIVLQLQEELQKAMNLHFEDEELSSIEQQFFISAHERAQRELSTAYARLLLEQAQTAAIPRLIEQVTRTLKPGTGPYRALLRWWDHFSQFRVGTADEEQTIALNNTRQDEKANAWLY